MPRATIASIAVLVPLGLAGCGLLSLTPSVCQPTHAYRAGEAQAMQGQMMSYPAAGECTGDDWNAYVTSFQSGYQTGRTNYCHPQRVWSAGVKDGQAGAPAAFYPQQYAICADVPALQAAYGKGHEAGLAQRCSSPGPEQAGRADGSKGLPARFDASPYGMCSEAQLQALAVSYQRGHDAGLAGFCAPQPWERTGHGDGSAGKPAASSDVAAAVCSPEQREAIAFHYRRGYEAGLARFCAPEPWERTGHGDGDAGKPAASLEAAVPACSTEQRERVASYYRRGYEAGLARFCAPERWERWGDDHGQEGKAPVTLASAAPCSPGQREVIEWRYARGYQAGLARYCSGDRFERWGHTHGSEGSQAVDIGSTIAPCSSEQRELAFLRYRRGYQDGLRSYCASATIAEAGRQAARSGSAPRFPDAYAHCLGPFAHLQAVFTDAYRTELAWIEHQWNSIPIMTAEQLQVLLANVKNAGFDSDRLTMIHEAARHSRFATEQVVALMGLLAFDNDKIEAAVALYPRVIDRANWFQAYAALDFSSSRDELQRRIAGL